MSYVIQKICKVGGVLQFLQFRACNPVIWEKDQRIANKLPGEPTVARSRLGICLWIADMEPAIEIRRAAAGVACRLSQELLP